MKPTPPGWPRISSAAYYRDAARAIDWFVEAFGFEVRLKIVGQDGVIEHSELTYGEGLIMIGQEGRTDRPDRAFCRSPLSFDGANTQSMMVFVDDAEAHCQRAREAGARIVSEPKLSDYGPEYWADLSYECADLEGHHWWFCQRMRTLGQPVT